MLIGNALDEKKKSEFYAILTSLITGIGIDSWLFLLGNWVIPVTWLGQSVCLGLGIIFTGMGVASYLQSNFAPNPMDRSMLVVSELTGWSVSYSRALISVILVLFAYFFAGGIGVMTLINALVSGLLIGFFVPYVEAIKMRRVQNPRNVESET